MRAPLRLALILLSAAATPAAAQQLGYGELPQDETTADGPRLHYALLDRFEYASGPGADGHAWDFSALWGGERDRLWIGFVGEGDAWDAPDYLELKALYARNVGGGLDLNVGLRWDALPRPDRFYGVFGGQLERGGLWLGAFAYLSHKGEVSARLVGTYNHALTKTLFLQPAFELDGYTEDIEALGIGRGFSYAELGLRLRFERDPRLAPYAGISWERSLGRTARLEREAGEDPEATSLVVGLRSEF